MNSRASLSLAGAALAGLLLAGCATKPFDYTNLRQHPPRSIVVLPPLNQSTAVQGTYGYLSTVTRPLAELGYYVFPVAVVDQFLKENGLPTAGEMHAAPLEKFAEILGADAVLFVTLEQYGTTYQIINSATTVKAKAKLVDTRTGLLLWEGMGLAQQNTGSSGNLIADAIAAALGQIINSSTDSAHDVSRMANFSLFYTQDRGLLFGPYHPKYAAEPP
jgi:hypothetical protein